MTFLEFVATKLMGPRPWLCPFHNERHSSFSIRPPKGDYPIKYKCFACGAWGDEFDLVRHFYPKDDYNRRLDRVRFLKLEYEATYGKPNERRLNDTKPATARFPSGDYKNDDRRWQAVNEAFDEVTQEVGHGKSFEDFIRIAQICERYGCDMKDFAKYCQEFFDWIDEGDRRHLTECDDLDCDFYVCRERIARR
jgi:hypothetical protein